eukprot:CAMPEP_0185589932 /NCGR_PEP_ID=MMETSP0434-20130131/58827_1 /TAXON_ID=626734 ORGANISM="Favella taraikaensis, Strain Fe Narragansett Bay" /NCGR_SAMPLE_ID=MMETSP0434 /ASSEMBLY_ACC=CAM_ASM_000379 /LENGTH=59 /DNA_ID=CAMNT_0028213707 /DNA_START=58 /DNA_END=234 /DNA_ORIENTATION=-
MKGIEKAESGKRGEAKMTEASKLGEVEKAFPLFTNACVALPEFAMAYYKRGKCYMMMHD